MASLLAHQWALLLVMLSVWRSARPSASRLVRLLVHRWALLWDLLSEHQ